MGRNTVDFGIDLGTTNSSIAVLQGTRPEIIKNSDGMDITPSAVWIDPRGTIRVGKRASAASLDENKAGNVHIEFKRRMGKDYRYEFESSGRSLRPEELSAEILKSLCGDAHSRFGEVVQAAAISVPAAFEQNQCAATRRAGELAGLIQSPLLQEPVAAALAFGFQADVVKELWLIYDFGGGTFDAAIIRAEEGVVSVVNHGGDNHLGGSDIDNAVVDQLVIPELVKNFDLPDFHRGNKRWNMQMALIKRSVENAKIELSREERAFLEDCRINDATGKSTEIDLELSRDALITVAEPMVERSIAICKRVLQEKSLAPGDIAKVILVGGPTLAPWFREILQSGLGIVLDYSVDPLTVVARGAAIFAGTQRLEGKMVPQAVAGQCTLDLHYKPIGADEDFTVRGEVASVSGTSVEGFTIEFVNDNTHWRSGKIPIGANGIFRANLLAEKGSKNVYTVELLDTAGRKQIVVPSQISYTVGLAVSEQPITNTISVALANNQRAIYFEKGHPLPARKTLILHTTHELRKGASGEVLKIPVVEGEAELADRNPLLGTLEVAATSVKRDVPVNTDVEVTLVLEATQGTMHVKGYVPILDEEFVTILKRNESSPDPLQLNQDLKDEAARLRALEEKAAEVADSQTGKPIAEVPDSGELEEIRGMIEAGDVDKAEKRLLELKVGLDKAQGTMQLPALILVAREEMDRLDELIAEVGSSGQRQQADDLRAKLEDAISRNSPDAVGKLLGRIHEMKWEILREQPSFWVGMFNHLMEEQSEMKDQQAASQLIGQGLSCIERENLQGLKNVVRQLYELLPREVAERITGYGSSVLN